MSVDPKTPKLTEWLGTGLRFGWAMSLLGAQSAVRLARGADPSASIDGVRREAERWTGSSEELLRSLDRVRGDVLELWAGVTGPGADLRVGSAAVGVGVGGTRRGLEVLARVNGAGSTAERAADILFVVERFSATAMEPLGDDPRSAVSDRAAELLGQEPFGALWSLEGLGHAYGEALWRAGRGDGPSGVGRQSGAVDLELVPRAASMPLMTGAALALARRFLRSRETPAERTGRFLDDCFRRAPAGSRLMLFEAAGFVAYQLLPLDFDVVADSTTALGDAATAAFWHGVGRALYLSFRGLATQRAPLEAAAGIPRELERRNALAGLVWASTLVHLRRPSQIESLLTAAAGRVDKEVVEHGVGGALTRVAPPSVRRPRQPRSGLPGPAGSAGRPPTAIPSLAVDPTRRRARPSPGRCAVGG